MNLGDDQRPATEGRSEYVWKEREGGEHSEQRRTTSASSSPPFPSLVRRRSETHGYTSPLSTRNSTRLSSQESENLTKKERRRASERAKKGREEGDGSELKLKSIRCWARNTDQLPSSRPFIRKLLEMSLKRRDVNFSAQKRAAGVKKASRVASLEVAISSLFQGSFQRLRERLFNCHFRRRRSIQQPIGELYMSNGNERNRGDASSLDG